MHEFFVIDHTWSNVASKVLVDIVQEHEDGHHEAEPPEQCVSQSLIKGLEHEGMISEHVLGSVAMINEGTCVLWCDYTSMNVRLPHVGRGLWEISYVSSSSSCGKFDCSILPASHSS